MSRRPDALALLDREMVFTQQKLMVPSGFEREARDRGIPLTRWDLGSLHEVGLLVPLYIGRRSMKGVRKAIRAAPEDAQPLIPYWNFAADWVGLRQDRDDGYLRIGSRGRLVTMRDIEGEPVQVAERLYSPYQLLALHRVRRELDVARKRRRRSALELIRLERARRVVEGDADLVILLSALEPHYYPRVVGSVSIPFRDGEWVDWHGLDAVFDAAELQDWLGWTSDALYDTARELLIRGHVMDPLEAWRGLADLVAPALWKRLKGDARAALDHRIAGEMILLFLEDLQPKGRAKPFPSIPRQAPHELNWRLRRDRERLDEVLTSFGLSPYPSVVLLVDGKTEMALLPLVMEELGIPRRDSHIRLVDRKSETRDHSLLLEYAALPKLGASKRSYAEFIRPPTRYFVVVDSDRHFRTPEAREQERQKWVRAVFAELPTAYQTDMAQAEIDSFVSLETWMDRLDCERANFTDEEISEALIACGYAPQGTTLEQVQGQLATQRQSLLGGHPRSLDEIWRDWPRQPSKPALALRMWPRLRARIRRKRSRKGLDAIPVARVLIRADELARRTPRRNAAFRLEEP